MDREKSRQKIKKVVPKKKSENFSKADPFPILSLVASEWPLGIKRRPDKAEEKLKQVTQTIFVPYRLPIYSNALQSAK